MTKDGKGNRFGRFVFEDSQAERVAAGDMSAVWEFIEDNRKHLTGWAKKFIRNNLSYLPNDRHGSFYKPEEMINQIFVDFPFYTLQNEKTLGIGIYCSFRGISCGGCRARWKARWDNEIRLDASTNVSSRNGDADEGRTLIDTIPSREPNPAEVLLMKEHAQEIAPRFYHEIKRLFKESGDGETTIGEIVSYQNGADAFRDVIEEIFFGYTLEEIQAYAKTA